MNGMAFRQRSTRKQVHLNVTSLIDVLFLLLIFFMLTGTFKRMGELELRLPESTTSAPAADAAPTQLELVVTESGDLLLDGEPVAMEDLKALLQARIDEIPDGQITIRAEESVTHGRIVRLLDIVRDSHKFFKVVTVYLDAHI